MLKLANKVNALKPSAILSLIPVAKEVSDKGIKIHPLFIGVPGIECMPSFIKGLEEKVETRMSNYSPVQGELELRKSYSNYINNYFDKRGVKHLEVTPENVLVQVGGSNALLNILLAICNPGDEVLTIEPFFSQYAGHAAVAEATVKAIPTRIENNFALPSQEEIENYISPKTKVLIINSPNNPSGKIYRKEDLTFLAKICLKHNLYFLSDEVYREMILGDNEADSLLQIDLGDEKLNEEFQDRLIIVDSVSKIFSLCGARVGFVIARPYLLKAIANISSYNCAAVNDAVQIGVAKAYDEIVKDRSFINNFRKLYKKRLDAALEAFQKYLPNAIVSKPDGAFYLSIKFPEVDDPLKFALFTLGEFQYENETVAITASTDFYQNPERAKGQFRLALVVPPEEMKRSIEILSYALKAYLKKEK